MQTQHHSPTPRATRRVRRLTALLLIGMTLGSASVASAKAPRAKRQASTRGPLPVAKLHDAYLANTPMVKRARTRGLDGAVLRFIENPQTPNDERAAAIRALYAQRPDGRFARAFARHLMHMRNATPRRFDLSRLATHEAFTLGYMLALEHPKTMRGLGGKSEVERADALMLLTAAVNRHRGDLTINLIYALAKAQLATTQPRRALCKPGQCVDAVLENYPVEWTMRPEAVCQIVSAVQKHTKSPPRRSVRVCAKVQKGAKQAPVYARNGQSPRSFTRPTPGLPATPTSPGLAAASPRTPQRFGARTASRAQGGHNAAQLAQLQRLQQMQLRQLQAMLPPGVNINLVALSSASPAQQHQAVNQLVNQLGAQLPPAERRMFTMMMGQMQQAMGMTSRQLNMRGAAPVHRGGSPATIQLRPNATPPGVAQGQPGQADAGTVVFGQDDTSKTSDAKGKKAKKAKNRKAKQGKKSKQGEKQAQATDNDAQSGTVIFEDGVSPGGAIPVDGGTNGRGPIPVDGGTGGNGPIPVN